MASIGELLEKGLLGYQPFFLKNGVVLGTGLQFFGFPDRKTEAAKGEYSFRQLGNIYIPPALRPTLRPNSDIYFSIDDEHIEVFRQQNELLKEMYRYFSDAVITNLRDRGIQVKSFIELGANTRLFPMLVSDSLGIRSTGVDIVDYGEAVDYLLKDSYPNLAGKVTCLHLKDNSAESLDELPKGDLAWSYAVALHQANPLQHIADLSTLATQAAFVMTTSAPTVAPGDMTLQFLTSNAYYQAPFPENFDVTLVSPALLEFSLKQVGFDEVVRIPFPEHLSESEYFQDWCTRHLAYLGIRKAPTSMSIYDFARGTERSPYRARKDVQVLVVKGRRYNIVLLDDHYWIVKHGLRLDYPVDRAKHIGFRSLNAARRQLESLEG